MGVGHDRLLEEIETVYRGRFRYFVQVARAIVGDRERAFEAVQDGFADAIRGRGGFRGDGPLEAWLWRAVVNAARKSVRRPLFELGDEGSEEAAEATPELLEVSPLVAALPERQRLIVFLRYYAGLSYSAIATALDIEVGTVSASLASAHAAVRKSLGRAEANG
jgi:RNA polymerase sigma-70 factor, ECF subfamily